MRQKTALEILDAPREPHHFSGLRQTLLVNTLLTLTFLGAWMGADTPRTIVPYSIVLGCALLALSAFDIRDGRLPNALTLPLIPIGLFGAFILNEAVFTDHIIGAVVGWAFFAALRTVYLRLRGVDGLGLGDVKLMAAAGAWLGWQGLPTMVLEASLLGLLWVASLAIARRPVGITERLPFGPFLCLACWVTWVYGPLAIL